MSRFNASRRDILKATGVGVIGLAGFSTIPLPTAGHESIDASATDLLGPIQVPADSDAGFNYPYYLYVPESNQTEPVPMLVEPNNTGTATDDFEEHRTAAKEFSQGRLGWTRTYSEALTVPLLVPVFPRPRSNPDHYVHALDETTMNLDSGELNRVDLQLINMVEHAQELLRDLSYPVADEILLNGFSASGNFVNRFTALHPDIVRSVTAGGVNGTLILPLERARGHTLNYHIGIADIDEVTGEPFDMDSWRDVAQFIYMGSEDENDTIPFSDAWSDQQRRIALDVYGEDMQDDRMPYCESVYDDAGADAEFKIYDGVDHRTPVEIQEDIVDFHREQAGLKQISFARVPDAGDTTLEVHATVFDERNQFDLRAHSEERGDITDTPTTITTGEPIDASIDLATPVEQSEQISAIVVPSGMTSPEEASASVTQSVTDPPSIQVVNQPTVTAPSITVEYTVSPSYETESPIHVYLGSGSNGTKQLLDTIRSENQGQITQEIDPNELDTSLEAGTQLQAALVDIDTDEQIATDSVVVGDSGQAETDVPASVTFDSQPTEGREQIEITYSVDGTYEPTAFLTLQLRIGEETSVLLSAIEPGETVTETFSLGKIPITAGDEIKVSIVDQRPIDTSRTVVVEDTNDAVDLQITERPTEDDPTTTVEYRIDETYQIKDSLTLRVYAGELPGTVPGESLILLSPGDTGTETFTVGANVDPPSEDLTVAIVDGAPLALTSTADTLGQESLAEQADESDEQAIQEESDETKAETTDGADLPGFGIGSALVSVGSLSYLLQRRFADDSTDDRKDSSS